MAIQKYGAEDTRCVEIMMGKNTCHKAVMRVVLLDLGSACDCMSMDWGST